MGAIVISIDAELGWGFHDFEVVPTERVERARWGWQKLLSLLDTYDLPATWAVVGHLLLEGCDGRHDDHPVGSGWFERERTDWRDRPDLRFGRDLVEAIDESGPDHEIASHTFSHVVFDDRDTSRAVARAEFRRSRSVATAEGWSVSSLVFPRNAVAHRDVLAEEGFGCYRGAMPETDRPGTVQKLAESTLFPSEPRIVHPAVDEYGLVNVPPSLYLFGFEGLARRITSAVLEDPIVARARRGIRAATEREGIFHIWLHPNNVTSDSDVERLERIFATVDDHRDELALRTMRDAAAQVRSEGETVTAR